METISYTKLLHTYGFQSISYLTYCGSITPLPATVGPRMFEIDNPISPSGYRVGIEEISQSYQLSGFDLIEVSDRLMRTYFKFKDVNYTYSKLMILMDGIRSILLKCDHCAVITRDKPISNFGSVSGLINDAMDVLCTLIVVVEISHPEHYTQVKELFDQLCEVIKF